MSLTYREVAEILKVIDASDCEELELEFEGVRLVMRRHGGTRVEELTGVTPDPEPTVPSGGSPGGAESPAEDTDSADTDSATTVTTRTDGRIEVHAPMVGTFYCRASPGDPPFVEQGATVERGRPLCLIEVMKLFTTLEATVAGTVSEILVADGELVEYGQALFVIDPAGDGDSGGD